MTDAVSSIYLYVLSLLAGLAAYGLLLFRWGSESGILVATSVFGIVVALLIFARYILGVGISTEMRSQVEAEGGRTSISYLALIAVAGPVLIFGLGFLLYQRLDYPRGFDGSWHYLYTESLLISGTLPTYELGTLSAPFYQRGYHMTLGALVILSGLELDLILPLFNLLIYSTIPLAAWLLTYSVLRSQTAAGFATLSTLFLASLIVVRGGNYPMLMSIHFLALGLAMMARATVDTRGIDVKLLVALALLGLILFATHPIVAEMYALFGVGFLVFVVVYHLVGLRKLPQLRDVSTALLPLFSVLAGVLLYFLLYPTFFGDQIAFAINRFSNAALDDPLLASAVRTAVPEAIILYLPMFLLPPALVGVLWSFRGRRILILSMVSVAAILFFVQILPIAAREPYIVLLPLTLVAGIGLFELFRSYLSTGVRRRSIALAAFAVFVVLVSANNMAQVASNPVIGPRSYLSDQEIAFAQLLLDQGVVGRRVATLNNPSMARIGVLSGIEVLVGDIRYTSLEQYRDIYLLVTGQNCSVIGELSAKYGIDGVLLLTLWSSTPSIVNIFTGCFEDSRTLQDSGIIAILWGS